MSLTNGPTDSNELSDISPDLDISSQTRAECLKLGESSDDEMDVDPKHKVVLEDSGGLPTHTHEEFMAAASAGVKSMRAAVSGVDDGTSVSATSSYQPGSVPPKSPPHFPVACKYFSKGYCSRIRCQSAVVRRLQSC